MQQMTLNLIFTSIPPAKSILRNTTWLDAGWATACLGFTKKVEISQALSDALQPLHAKDEDEDEHDQQLYDALWMAHHRLVLDQRPSISFTFDFLRDDKILGSSRKRVCACTWRKRSTSSCSVCCRISRRNNGNLSWQTHAG